MYYEETAQDSCLQQAQNKAMQSGQVLGGSTRPPTPKEHLLQHAEYHKASAAQMTDAIASFHERIAEHHRSAAAFTEAASKV